jgi:cystathionine beta-synthase
MGTGGTISGVARYLKERKPSVHVVGADPEGSLYSGPIAPYKVEGVGEDFMPGTMDIKLVDQIVQVTDKQSFVAARRLAREEGILVGGSSGLALHAALEVAAERGPDEVIVVLFPDTGRNYLSKFFNDEWMRQNGYLARLGAVRIREVLLAHPKGLPKLVTVEAGKSVGEAIDLMQQYGISQLPVVEESNGKGVVGTLQERTLLDRVYRDPAVVTTAVSAAMDAPLSQIGVDSSLDDAFEPLLRGEQAVLVVEAGNPVAMITRADLLEFVAHRGQG